jgi:CheY-like chemotaxis protein
MTHKLLLADDSVTIQRVIELTFADEDVEVIAVGDGRQAIERIEADRPDIVLADVGMPERDGYEVAAFVKRTPHLAHIPVLLLTGAFEPVDYERASSAGCDGVLAKPFEPHMVITRVKELLADAPKRRTAAAAPRRPEPVATRTEDLRDDLRPPVPDAAPVPVVAEHIPASRVRTVDLGEAQPLATSELQPGPVPQVVPADPAGLESLVESPLDAAVRISRRTPFAVPGFGTPPAQAPAGRSLDDYFDRLDAAFASLHQAPAPPAVLETDPEGERSTGPDTPPAHDDAGPAPPPAAAQPAAAPVLAQAFSALFAAEHGDAGAPALPAFYAAPQASTDELVERVTEQVLQRLTDRVVRETVTDIVSRVAERLVRDEIDRVRSTIK